MTRLLELGDDDDFRRELVANEVPYKIYFRIIQCRLMYDFSMVKAAVASEATDYSLAGGMLLNNVEIISYSRKHILLDFQ